MVDDLLLPAPQNHPDRQPQVTNPLVDLADIVLDQRSTAAATAIDTVESPPDKSGAIRITSSRSAATCSTTHSVPPHRSPHSRSEHKAQPSCSASTTTATTSPQPTGNSSSNGWAAPTKLDHATTAAPGSPSSPELIKRDDGKITAEDGPGLGGPRFTVTLPNARQWAAPAPGARLKYRTVVRGGPMRQLQRPLHVHGAVHGPDRNANTL